MFRIKERERAKRPGPLECPVKGNGLLFAERGELGIGMVRLE